MKNKIIIILIIISNVCFSQNKRQIDSLLKLIQNSNDTTKLNCYNLLGKLYQSNNNEKVKEYGHKIIELATKTKNQKYIAAGYLKIGVYFHLENKFDSALYYYNKTIILSKAANNLIIEADAHQDLGILYSSIANDQKAIDELIIAQKIQHQLKNTKKSADLLNSIAVIFIRQKNNNQAEKYILESIALMDTTIQKGLLGYQYTNLGIIYENKSQFQKAINYQRKALLEFSQINDLRGMAACYNNLFLSFVNQNKIDSALIFNNKLKINSKKQNDIGNEFFSNLNFSIAYQRFLNKPVYAKCYLDSMREILPKLNKPELYSVFYQESATYNFLYGNKDTGYFYMDKFLGLKDSLTSSENAQITNELQTKYETEKKDLELK